MGGPLRCGCIAVHHTLSRGPRVVASSRRPPPSRSQRPTNKPTIETFPKRAIYLLPINRSAVIKKSMWPGWASISLPGKGAFARARRTAERQHRLGTGVPGSHPSPDTWTPWPGGGGLSRPRGPERWTPMRHASAPSLFSPARRGAGAASGCGGAPRLLLLLGQLNRDFVKRDR